MGEWTKAWDEKHKPKVEKKEEVPVEKKASAKKSETKE